MKKKILYGIIVIIVVLQFFRIDKTNPTINRVDDFIEQTNPPDKIVSIIQTTCYDCHSNETKYPWYSNVAPISWWVKDHINEARDELNFSEWGTYKEKRKDHKLEEMAEMLEDGEMPLDEYTWTHTEANLTDKEKTMLMDWFKSIREEMKPAVNELQLNNGEKWEVNLFTDSLIQHMVNIITEEVEEGRMAYYGAMAQRIIIDIDTWHATEANKGSSSKEMVKLFIPISEMAMILEEEEVEEEALIFQKNILKQLNKYNKYFETD